MRMSMPSLESGIMLRTWTTMQAVAIKEHYLTMLKEFDMEIDEHKFLDLWTLELGLEEISFMSGTRFDCYEESIAHAELDKLLDSLVVGNHQDDPTGAEEAAA